MRRIQLRFAPAQKAGPFAPSTMAFTCGAAPASVKACVSSAMTTSSNALRASG
jgi:hypothetical protein